MAKSKLGAEFKAFILRGNVVDLAVGIMIGGAFQKIVSSFVNDLVMPLIGLLTGGSNFDNQFVILRMPEGVTEAEVTSLAVAKELGVTTFNYGAFLSVVLDFLIMAFVIFLLVKAINGVHNRAKKPEAPAAPTTKTCPFCRSQIAIEATRCPHCTSEQPEEEKKEEE
ncbi:MAG: large conductance mechanosensitive channel protein MscL [Clostridia bacterium]|nr:large conductance mechanosensitive channel protein MscL [Clostridia bacterium]